MAGGKSTKRVNLRTKIARKQQAQHADASSQQSNVNPASTTHDFAQSSASPATVGESATTTTTTATATTAAASLATAAHAPYGHRDEDRQTALHIRNALRQRQGRQARPTATSGSTPATTSLKKKANKKSSDERVSSKRQSAKKESKKDATSMHPAALRRAAAAERKRLLLPAMSAAEARMAAAQEELQLFEKVQTVPAYAADPFAAVMQHLSATMDTLKPQTPDIGRAARD